jgi:hypothetical protein
MSRGVIWFEAGDPVAFDLFIEQRPWERSLKSPASIA